MKWLWLIFYLILALEIFLEEKFSKSVIEREYFKNMTKIAKNTRFSYFSRALTFEPVRQILIVIPVFHLEFEVLQNPSYKVFKIPPDGGFGDFHWLFWLLSGSSSVISFTATPQKLAFTFSYMMVWSNIFKI